MLSPTLVRSMAPIRHLASARDLVRSRTRLARLVRDELIAAVRAFVDIEFACVSQRRRRHRVRLRERRLLRRDRRRDPPCCCAARVCGRSRRAHAVSEFARADVAHTAAIDRCVRVPMLR